MSNVKISALPPATTPLAGTEEVPIVQSGATVKVAVSDLTAGRSIEASQVDITAQGDLRLQDSTGGEYVGFQAPATLGSSYILTMPTTDGNSGEALVTDGTGVLSWSYAASGDVYGPASSTDNALARFDSTTGKIIQDSVGILSDAGALSGLTGLSSTSGTFSTTLGVTGVATFTAQPILSSLTASSAVATDASKGLVSVTNTGTGNNVLATSPTLVTPILGTPTSVTLTNATGLPLTTGVTGTLPVGNGGTGVTTLTLNGVVYGNGTSAAGITAAGTTGQVLIATTSGAPSWGAVPSTAAVTSITFGTTGLTPATATTGAVTVAGTLVAVNGGTGQSSYAVGDLLYASTTTALSKLADVATGNALISGGVGVAPSWGKIALTTHISGVLPVANGGTNASTASITSFNNITGYTAAGATGTTSTNLVFSASPTFTGTIAGASLSLSSLTSGRVTYAGASGLLTDSANLTFDGSNLGLGVTPSAWATLKGFDISSNGSVYGFSNQVGMTSNAYYGTAWTYKATGLAAYYTMGTGVHSWNIAASGTAGNPITWTTAMTLDASGNLGIGTSSPSSYGKLAVVGAAANTLSAVVDTTGYALFRSTNTSGQSYVGVDSSAGTLTGTAYATTLWGQNAYPTIFATNSTERMRIDSSGNVGIGTSSPSYPLDVLSNSSAIGVSIRGRSADNISLYNFTSNNGATQYGYVLGSLAELRLAQNGANYITAYTNGSERMRIDSSGNVGIGVTPSAWSSGFKALQIGSGLNGGAIAGDTSFSTLYSSSNAYNNSGWKYVKTGEGAALFRVYGYDGSFYWDRASSGTAGGAITFTTAMTLDASGNLLVGTTTSPSGTSNIVPAATKGINFAANTPLAGATSQLLNWYEEGTWTPAQGSGLTVVGTFSSIGRYVRVGKQMTVSGSVSGSTSIALAGGAAILTNNLPQSASIAAVGVATNSGATASSIFQASVVTLYNVTAIAATSQIIFSVTYNLN